MHSSTGFMLGLVGWEVGEEKTNLRHVQHIFFKELKL